MKSSFTRHVKVAATGMAAAMIVATAPLAASAEKNSASASGTPLYLAYAWVPNATPSQSAEALSRAQKRQIAARQRYYGNGSYICSPSGFGKRSRCFAR